MSTDVVIDSARGNDGTVVVSVEGELDMTNAGEFKRKLRDAITSSGQAGVVDLSGCGFIDSSGLNALLHASRALAPGAPRLSVVGAQPYVLKVLQITQLDNLLAVHSEERAAQNGHGILRAPADVRRQDQHRAGHPGQTGSTPRPGGTNGDQP